MRASILARQESWALRQPFTISRGTKSTADVIVVEIRDREFLGRGECVPYHRYGETLESVMQQIDNLTVQATDDLNTDSLQQMLPPGAARNALDCAFWDLRAKQADVRLSHPIRMDPPTEVVCAYTLSLDNPDAMHRAAKNEDHRPLLKMKVGAEGALEQVAAVRKGAPNSRLIVDANEAWDLKTLQALLPQMKTLGVGLIEQPLPAGQDKSLAKVDRIVPIAADESCHCVGDIPRLVAGYDVVNIKLDKTGGLTEALELYTAARAAGLGVMVGCMIATSLSMAPATIVATQADFVDLDGPLLLANDRTHGLRYANGCIAPPSSDLWG